LPELSTTAAARPSCRCSRLTCTGAAATRFDVKTPAAVTAAWSAVATSARSGAPDALMPHASPPAAKPAAVTLIAARPLGSRREPGDGERGRLREAEEQIGALDRLARCALHEVVERADREHGVR